MHEYETTLRLGRTDSLGIAFYSSVFEIAHECYESFLNIAAILQEGRYIIPIVHAEADYRAPMELSDKITVEMRAGGRGKSSFTLEYTMTNQRSEVVAGVKTVHAVLDRNERKPIEIPGYIGEKLSELSD